MYVDGCVCVCACVLVFVFSNLDVFVSIYVCVLKRVQQHATMRSIINGYNVPHATTTGMVLCIRVYSCVFIRAGCHPVRGRRQPAPADAHLAHWHLAWHRQVHGEAGGGGSGKRTHCAKCDYQRKQEAVDSPPFWEVILFAPLEVPMARGAYVRAPESCIESRQLGKQQTHQEGAY